MTVCYLCGRPADLSRSSGDHVIPRTLLGDRPPKIKGFEYGGKLHTHPECNNRFGDETYARKALQLLGALHDSETTLARDAPGNPNALVLALNEEKLPSFGPRDFRFFGMHDARHDSLASLDDPEYYADKPPASPGRIALSTSFSVLAKSASALLVRRHLADLPSSWNIVCVPYGGDVTRVDLSPFLGVTKPFAKDIRVWMNGFEGDSWLALYATRSVMVWLFFLMEDDRNLVEAIQSRFPCEQCFQFQGKSLMDLVGHDWPPAGHVRT